MVQMNETEIGVPKAGDAGSPPKPVVIIVDDAQSHHDELMKRLQEAAPGLEPVEAPNYVSPLINEDEPEKCHLPEGCSREEYQELMKNPELSQAVEEATKRIEEHVPGVLENPIHQNADGKWYFWDEIWVDEIGPYETREEANTAINEYAADLEKEHQYRALHPHRFPRKKLHPHKRSLSIEDRKLLKGKK